MIPSHCRAAALVERGEPLEIIEVEVPAELESGALLVRNRAATICATDVHLAEGGIASKDAADALPVILGHEMVGEVVAMNGNDRDSVGRPLAPGDRVVWTPGSCGQCPACVIEKSPTLCRNRRGYMTGKPTEYPYLTGGFAEYGYVFPTSGRIKVPAEISDAVASASSCALRTVIHAFDRLGPLDERHTVVVLGAGPLGLFSLTKAVTAGARQVIVVGGPSRRLELASAWGADHVIDIDAMPDPEERLQRIMELTDGRGAEAVVEMSGVPAAFGEGVEMLRRGGRYLIVGQIHDTEMPFNPSQIVMKQATVIGSLSGAVDHYARALDFMATHRTRFAWDDMISSHQPLDDINAAMGRMGRHEEIKPALMFG